MTMDELKPGQSAYISSVGGSGALRHHLLDMGLTPQTEITLQKVAPMGDPVQFQLRGYELTLRLEEARKVTVDQVHTKPVKASVVGARRNSSTPHPGVGELVKAGGYHTVHDGAAIPKGSPLTFALAGNQNCGKTTLFNQLTGSNQHVGNFPGVTVDRKDGTIRSHPEATVTDLPGIYSLSPYSNEEIVTRDFLLNTHPSGIINIVDASNIERNLYLTMQLMELGIGLVDGLAAGGNVLDHDHTVAVLGLITQQVALIGTVVLGLLTVAAVLNLLAVQLVVGNGGHDSQRNTLVGRPKQDVKVVAKVIVDGLGVILAQLLELIARHVSAGVHKERGLAAALERKAAELKNVGLDHELDELLLVSLHAGSSRNRVRAFQFSAGEASMRARFEAAAFCKGFVRGNGFPNNGG